MFLLRILLFTLQLVFAQKFIDVDSEIYFKKPEIPLRGFNFTISGNRPLAGPSEREFNQATLVASAALCQVNLINKGLTDVKLDGILNFALNDYDQVGQTAQFAQMQIYQASLYNKTTNQVLNPTFPPSNSYFGLVSEGNSKIDAAITGASIIPLMSSGSFAQSDPIGNILYFNQFINQTLFAVQASTNVTVFNAVVSFLQFMNWTLVGTVYEATIFGYSNQQRVKIFQETESKPFFACGGIFDGFLNQVLNPQMGYERGLDFCSCVEEFEKISVVVLFATLNNAFLVADYINKTCNSPDFTYIIAAENSFTPSRIRESNATVLANSFLIRSFYDWDYKTFYKTCFDSLDDPKNSIVYQSHAEFFQTSYACLLGTSEIADSPICTQNRTAELEPCLCSDQIFDSTTNGLPQLFYTVDAVTTIAEALSLLQNNCTVLNEKQSTYAPNTASIDFCSLTTITPATFNYALRVVNFTGYTGRISFPSFVRERLDRNYYIYQISDSVSDASYIGNYSINGPSFNAAAISFPDGKIPFSAIVINEPTLSDAIVAVNFGLSIFFLGSFTAIFVFMLLNRNNPILRRNSPLITEIMCIGIALHSLELLLYSFGVNDALCWISQYVGSIATALYLGALLSKNYRIYRIFSQEGAVALQIKTSRLLWFIAGMVVYFLLLQLFILLDGFGAKQIIAEDNPFYIYLICASNTSALNDIYSIIINVTRIVLLLVACVLSFLIRKVHVFYNESLPLAVISYTFLMTVILLVPLYYLLSGSTDSENLRYAVRAQQLIIFCLVVLCIYFLPLVWKVMKNTRERSVE